MLHKVYGSHIRTSSNYRVITRATTNFVIFYRNIWLLKLLDGGELDVVDLHKNIWLLKLLNGVEVDVMDFLQKYLASKIVEWWRSRRGGFSTEISGY
jgi:hypothetical protein